VLGVPAIKGRTFTAEEEQPGHERLAVISHGAWIGASAAPTTSSGNRSGSTARCTKSSASCRSTFSCRLAIRTSRCGHR
jgi:hypothetical protein